MECFIWIVYTPLRADANSLPLTSKLWPVHMKEDIALSVIDRNCPHKSWNVDRINAEIWRGVAIPRDVPSGDRVYEEMLRLVKTPGSYDCWLKYKRRKYGLPNRWLNHKLSTYFILHLYFGLQNFGFLHFNYFFKHRTLWSRTKKSKTLLRL